ncbi:MAG TPA: hypothetical protein VGG28_02305 [Kofleriaceae bacterium]|jgi:hypothetical protein
MKWLCLLLAVSACGGTGESTGARGDCAAGGELNAGTCPADPTPDGACMYLVDCGVIPIESDAGNGHHFDWADCVDTIDGFIPTAQQLAIECIESATCDSLLVDGSPEKPNQGEIACLHLGDN